MQRAGQLSNILKKIAISKKFTNFDLLYVDFDFQEGKCRLVWVMKQTAAAATGESLPQPGTNRGQQVGQGLSCPSSHTGSSSTEIR